MIDILKTTCFLSFSLMVFSCASSEINNLDNSKYIPFNGDTDQYKDILPDESEIVAPIKAKDNDLYLIVDGVKKIDTTVELVPATSSERDVGIPSLDAITPYTTNYQESKGSDKPESPNLITNINRTAPSQQMIHEAFEECRLSWVKILEGYKFVNPQVRIMKIIDKTNYKPSGNNVWIYMAYMDSNTEWEGLTQWGYENLMQSSASIYSIDDQFKHTCHNDIAKSAKRKSLSELIYPLTTKKHEYAIKFGLI